MPSSGEDILRLAAVIDRQRQELDRARSGAAARSVIDMARGALMERLGCSAGEAASQLTALAAEAGTPVAEIAAAIIGHDPAPPGVPEASGSSGTSEASVPLGADGTAGVERVRGAEGSRPALTGLLDGLLETVLIASALRDGDGNIADFRIDHAGETFRDPAGRTAADITGHTLLETYPTAGTAGGLLEHAVRVLTTGHAQHVPGPILSAPAGEVRGAVADVRIARFFDGIVLTWRLAGEIDQLSARLLQIQRLGRIGAWEENLATGMADWTDAAFELFGLPVRDGAAIPIADLHSYVTAMDVPAVKRFRETLLQAREPTGATFRIVRADDGSVRQMRVFAEPVLSPAGTVEAIRGAFQDISAVYQAQVALAATRDQLADTEHRAAEEHLLAVRLQQAIMPPTTEPVETAGIEVAVRYRRPALATWSAATGTTRCCCRARKSCWSSGTSPDTASTR